MLGYIQQNFPVGDSNANTSNKRLRDHYEAK